MAVFNEPHRNHWAYVFALPQAPQDIPQKEFQDKKTPDEKDTATVRTNS